LALDMLLEEKRSKVGYPLDK